MKLLIPLYVYTDSKSLFNLFIDCYMKSENILISDIKGVILGHSKNRTKKKRNKTISTLITGKKCLPLKEQSKHRL